mmetsp:Transcript_19861/g.56916  ORF Transcript_19861/g.56916 Transcript_19861/m.56916 type:complete len:225 (-) Transcript_19861:1245-1919(-)
MLHAFREEALCLAALDQRLFRSSHLGQPLFQDSLNLQALHLAAQLHLEVFDLLECILGPFEHLLQLVFQHALRRLDFRLHEFEYGPENGHRRCQSSFCSGKIIRRRFHAGERRDQLFDLQLRLSHFVSHFCQNAFPLEFLLEVLPHSHVRRDVFLYLVQLVLQSVQLRQSDFPCFRRIILRCCDFLVEVRLSLLDARLCLYDGDLGFLDGTRCVLVHLFGHVGG